MKVYVLIAITEYEGKIIVEMYSTREKADQACKEHTANNLNFFFEVEEWTLE